MPAGTRASRARKSSSSTPSCNERARPAPPEGFRLLSGEAELTRYLFNTGKNHHFFCRHCSVRAFGVGNDTPVGQMVGVNLGCLVDVGDEELARVPVTFVDGLHDRMAPPAVFSHL